MSSPRADEDALALQQVALEKATSLLSHPQLVAPLQLSPFLLELFELFVCCLGAINRLDRAFDNEEYSSAFLRGLATYLSMAKCLNLLQTPSLNLSIKCSVSLLLQRQLEYAPLPPPTPAGIEATQQSQSFANFMYLKDILAMACDVMKTARGTSHEVLSSRTLPNSAISLLALRTLPEVVLGFVRAEVSPPLEHACVHVIQKWL